LQDKAQEALGILRSALTYMLFFQKALGVLVKQYRFYALGQNSKR
jgi:hypothetical protein